MPYQRNQELSSLEVNGRAIIFRVKQCSHFQEMFGIGSRYLVSIGDTCRPRTLSTWDLNTEVPPELY